jgi:hypothetical protein
VTWLLAAAPALAVLVFGILLWFGKLPHIVNPIRGFAVLCVAVTSGYVMWMGWRLSNILASPDWCSKALQAERITPGNSFVGLTACVDLLKIQLKAIATDSHVFAGVVAMCLLTLIVIVIAGGRLQFAASKSGISGNMSSAEDEAASAAAAQTAGAAVAEAGKIATEGAKPASQPVEPSPRPV